MDANTVAKSLNKFALEFCNELENKTSVCSPVSAEIALALIALGSSNEAHAELLKALSLHDDDAIRSAFSFLTSTLQSMRDMLKVATKVYLKKGDCELRKDVQKDAEDVFGAALEQMDFTEEDAAGRINTWVAEQTNDKIKNIVSADMMDENTCMLLLNAIYFKGSWEIPFKPDLTSDQPFSVNENTVIKVPMMQIRNERFFFGRSIGLNSMLIRIPYSSNDSSMVIVLPNEVEGLKDVMKQLAAGHDLMADLGLINKVEVNVTIPKFKVESTINLKPVLQKLGIRSIFNQACTDIDRLISGEKLYVSDAIQKAFIDVNEEGTEAAACTVHIKAKRRCLHDKKTIRFIADRPFLYFILSQNILIFVGNYYGNK